MKHLALVEALEARKGLDGRAAREWKEHNLKPTLTIEEYSVMGKDKPDPKDWETNVHYLHE